jgi:hypothetical protein
MKRKQSIIRWSGVCGLALCFLSVTFLSRAAFDDTVKVEGVFNGQAGKTYTIDWYFAKNKSCSDNGASQPLTMGKIPVTTNEAGSATYSLDFKFPRGSKKGKIIMSASDDTGTKTDFKACHDVSED